MWALAMYLLKFCCLFPCVKNNLNTFDVVVE